MQGPTVNCDAIIDRGGGCLDILSSLLAGMMQMLGRSKYEDAKCGDIPWTGGPSTAKHGEEMVKLQKAIDKCISVACKVCPKEFLSGLVDSSKLLD